MGLNKNLAGEPNQKLLPRDTRILLKSWNLIQEGRDPGTTGSDCHLCHCGLEREKRTVESDVTYPLPPQPTSIRKADAANYTCELLVKWAIWGDFRTAAQGKVSKVQILSRYLFSGPEEMPPCILFPDTSVASPGPNPGLQRYLLRMGDSPKCFLEGHLSAEKDNIFSGLVPVLCGTACCHHLGWQALPPTSGTWQSLILWRYDFRGGDFWKNLDAPSTSPDGVTGRAWDVQCLSSYQGKTFA